MFANVDDWKSNPERELEGVPLDLGRGRSILLRRAGGANRAFMVALAEAIRARAGERDPKDVPDEELDDDIKRLYSEFVVVDWSGFVDEAGETIPYTRENFLLLMSMAPDMWIRIRSTANTRETFHAEADRKAMVRDKDAIKKASRGKRNGAHTAHA